MADKILVVKQKGYDQKMTAKVSNRGKGQYIPHDYVKTFNPHNPNDIALLLGDLKVLFGAPIEKAFRRFKEGNRDFPFF